MASGRNYNSHEALGPCKRFEVQPPLRWDSIGWAWSRLGVLIG